MGSDKKKKLSKKKANKEQDGVPENVAGGKNHERGGKSVITDARFASVHSDPRFQNVPTQKSKVAIDSRFDRMFTDKSFATSSAPSDKRGKPKPKQKSENNPLRHYYRIEEGEKKKSEDIDEVSDEEDSEEVEEKSVKDFAKLDKLNKKSMDSEESESEDEDDIEVNESEYSTDSDDDDEIGDDYMEDDEETAVEESIPVTEEETRRLAIVNMDWRHVRAVDLYVVLISFLPKGRQIFSVTVYPSEFGLKRMEEEAIHGPIALFGDKKEKGDSDDDDDDSEDEIDEDKLRAYEQSKLRYYFAVVECDSVVTANLIYERCDGVEFERSSNKLDLRFIPDTMEFKHPPRDVATEEPSTYEGLDFYTRELQHSKVNLTWDEDEPHRAKTLKRKFNDDQLSDFKDYLASDNSDEEDDENDSDKKDKNRNKYSALLLSGNGSDDEEKNDQDMEVTFNTGLEDLSKRFVEKKDKSDQSVWEAYLEKKREKKKHNKNKSENSSDDESSDEYNADAATEDPDDFFLEEPAVKKRKNKKKQKEEMDKEEEASKAELELLLADDNGENDKNVKGYNLKPKKAKGKKEKRVTDEEKLPSVDYDDPRFSAMFTSHLYALDPTDPQFKRSAAYARQLAQKQQMKDVNETGHTKKPAPESQPPSDESAMRKNNAKSDLTNSNKEKYELSSMLKSIKMKTQQLPSNGVKNLKKCEKTDKAEKRNISKKKIKVSK